MRQEYLGQGLMIFLGWAVEVYGDGRATHEQSLRFACLCPSGEYRSLASLGCRGRAFGPCGFRTAVGQGPRGGPWILALRPSRKGDSRAAR